MNTEQGLTLLGDIDAIRIGLVHLQGGPQNWTTSAYAATKSDDGATIYGTRDVFELMQNPDHKQACSTCMLGAGFLGSYVKAQHSGGSTTPYPIEDLMQRAYRRLGHTGYIPVFNDAQGRTYEEALAMYEAIYHNILDHYGIPRDWYKESAPCSA